MSNSHASSQEAGTTAVPYDADLSHPWAALRIPRIGSPLPWLAYEVAVWVPSDELPGLPRLEPCNDEAQVIASFIRYRLGFYRASSPAARAAEPFDVNETVNTVVLAKLADGWRYRLASWEIPGAPLLNDRGREGCTPDKAGLVQLLDYVQSFGPRWKRWKADHDDLFAAARR